MAVVFYLCYATILAIVRWLIVRTTTLPTYLVRIDRYDDYMKALGDKSAGFVLWLRRPTGTRIWYVQVITVVGHSRGGKVVVLVRSVQ